jgi:hypothetical protein
VGESDDASTNNGDIFSFNRQGRLCIVLGAHGNA